MVKSLPVVVAEGDCTRPERVRKEVETIRSINISRTKPAKNRITIDKF